MKTSLWFPILLILLRVDVIHAGSATWSLSPSSGDWNTATNWNPATVPNDPADVATFGLTTRPAVSLSAASEVDSVVFSSGASQYTISVFNAQGLTMSGLGIVNDSGIVQNFVGNSDFGYFGFTESASAGEMTLFTLTGGRGLDATGGDVNFSGTSSAGAATFTLNGSLSGGASGGQVQFFDKATAENSTITVGASDSRNRNGGYLYFYDNSTAGNATITAQGPANADASGGSIVFFSDGATAGGATIVCEGATAAGGLGSHVSFTPGKGGAATLIANGGMNGGTGGSIGFYQDSKGESARVEIFGNGRLDVSFLLAPGNITIGSLEGDGVVLLGNDHLSIGSNNLSTVFAGAIQDGGTLTKLGTGTLTLSGASIYTGATTVSGGALVVSNTTGSATGIGSITVSGGTLGGGGIISGAVTLGTGSGTGATLQPSFGTTKKIALTIQSLLTFKSDSTYSFRLKSKNAEVIANGVTVESGAQFQLTAPNRKLPTGKSATVISNTATTPISGTFVNLPDGGTITSGSNTFQANYEGGDGNDLTLTVLP